MTNKQIYKKISAALISCGETLHHLEDLKHIPLFKGAFKNLLNRVFKHLLKIESDIIDKLDKEDDYDLRDKMMSNSLLWVEDLAKGSGVDKVNDLKQAHLAYLADKEKFMRVVNKINFNSGGVITE